MKTYPAPPGKRCQCCFNTLAVLFVKIHDRRMETGNRPQYRCQKCHDIRERKVAA